MSETRANIEIIAPSIEEAIARGLDELNLPESAVEVEILDSGSRGLFGLGSRQARVRLTVKPEKDPGAAYPSAEQEKEPGVYTGAEIIESAFTKGTVAEMEIKTGTPHEPVNEQDEHTLLVARELVEELLQKMGVRAKVTSRISKPDEQHGKSSVWVDIRGDDLSFLIGPRSETLNALQYIASLIVSNELGKPVSLVVDVEGYRVRRAQQIRQIAQRMADQAVKTGRRQMLEPMPASERRLVHIELRSNPLVTTESVGEEPRRKVTIIPKP